MLQVRAASKAGEYVVVNVTISRVVFGPASYSDCVQVVEKDRADDNEADSYHPSRGDYLKD